MSNVDTIKEKLGIVEVVGSYIKLEKAGASYKARCPFHNEKTPSFFVSPDRGTYYCFGCAEKGDIFSFVEKFEGLDFQGALKVLAERAGVTLDRFEVKNKGAEDRLFAVLDAASLFFEENISKNIEARSYIEKRGLMQKTIKEWRIGYAELEWHTLYEHLASKGFTADEMTKTGLIKKSEKPGGVHPFYDTFRGRIMFPIFDSSGRVIAFSGRIFVDDGKSAKYVNSPETALFKKSEVLYGLHQAKLDIRKKDYTILVEGQMDILMCQQAGFTNTVASSGTALTVDHLKKIQRLSNRIVVAFDGDSAGFAATERSAHLALALGMEVKVARLPKGDDPASLILKDVSLWKDVLKSSSHIIDFYTDTLLASGSNPRTIGKSITEKVLPFVVLLQSAIEQSHFVREISRKTGIKEDAIWEDLKKVKNRTPGSGASLISGDEKKQVDEIVRTRKDSIEEKLMGIIVWQESLSTSVIDITDLKAKFEAIIGKDSYKKLESTLAPAKDALIFGAESYYGEDKKIKEDILELLFNLEKEYLQHALYEARVELQEAERVKDLPRQQVLIKRCTELIERVARLTKK